MEQFAERIKDLAPRFTHSRLEVPAARCRHRNGSIADHERCKARSRAPQDRIARVSDNQSDRHTEEEPPGSQRDPARNLLSDSLGSGSLTASYTGSACRFPGISAGRLSRRSASESFLWLRLALPFIRSNIRADFGTCKANSERRMFGCGRPMASGFTRGVMRRRRLRSSPCTCTGMPEMSLTAFCKSAK